MKHRPGIITLAAGCGALTASAPAQAPFTYETSTELSSTGDFDGDGRADVVILDRETGAMRTLTQQAGGDFTAGSPEFTGLEAAGAMTVGKLRTGETRDRAVAASAAGNRVLGLALTPASTARTDLNGLLSPTALAAVPVPTTTAQLVVSTEQNNAPTPRLLSPVDFNGAALSVGAFGLPQPSPLRRGNGVAMKRGAARQAAFVALPSREASEFRLFVGGDAASIPEPATTGGLPPDAQWTTGFYAPLKDNPAFLFYARNSKVFTTRQSAETAPQTYAFSDAGTYDLGKPIHLLMTVTYDNKSWLLALFEEGASATLYNFDAANRPVARQQWSAPPGEKFTTAAALGQGGFLLFSGAGGRSSNWSRFDYDGSRHRSRRGGALAALSARDHQVTVFLFNQEPFVNPDALVYEMRREGDWTSRGEPGAGGNWQLTTLSDSGPESGLGDPAQRAFSFPPSLLPVINQYLRPAGRANDLPISIASFSAQEGAVSPVVHFDPPPGAYPEALSTVTNFPDPSDPDAPEGRSGGSGLPVTLSTIPGAVISYRFSPDEPWKTYTGPLRLTGTSSIYARTVSQYPSANTLSPVVSGLWTLTGTSPPFQPATLPTAVDADGNSLADAWEAAFDQHDPNADPDNDGLTNREEYQAGSDPLVPGDGSANPNLPLPPLALNSQVVTDEGTRCLELTWDRANAGAELQYSADLENWLTVREGIETTSENIRVLIPLNSPAAKGYFRLYRP